MKRSVIILTLTLAASVTILSQVAPGKYFIEFTDKANSPYSISQPEDFLSQRAIDRRSEQAIAIEENDIPVNQSYVDSIRRFNIQVLTRSKWLNGVTISCPDPSIIDSILMFPFVKRVLKDEFIRNVYASYSDNKFKSEEVILDQNSFLQQFESTGYNSDMGFNYGPSFNQIHMLRGDSLHNLGYRGQGMVIAVLDAGFYHVDVLPAFDSLRLNDQILGTRDFVLPGNNVYNEYEHGMEVLSCMGGNVPGQIIGTAPKAKYWLLRTEDVHSEYIIEEYNWVAAAEFADSAGADIINSSLGYTVFNDSVQNHTCQDMNGHTTPATRGANIADGKGMIVVNSAGNSGGSSWKCVSSPADGYYVMAVAAVDSNGIRAGFSSTGEATARIKPNTAAMGRGVIVSSSTGSILYNNGTSFSSPIMAGMAACLWQSAPGQSNHSIIRAIERSGSQASHPDSLLGYGVPDIVKAMQHLNIDMKDIKRNAVIYPNPFTGSFSVSFYSPVSREIRISLVDRVGQIVYSDHRQHIKTGENQISIGEIPGLYPGIYFLEISCPGLFITSKVTKIRTW